MTKKILPWLRRCALPVALMLANAASGADARDYQDPDFDYFVRGDPSAPRAAHTEFGLALMGGGGSVDAAFRFISAHAGHGHIVILRAVSDDSHDPEGGDYGDSFATEWGPVASAVTIVFHDRIAASDPRVVAALDHADGIFLAGGDQANYVRYWKGTPVQAALDAHVRANRPIGGSSAGLAVLGHFSYTAFDGGSITSAEALADPLGPAVTLEDDFLHFRGLERVITDTHFFARQRLGRLVAFIARLESARSAHGREAATCGVGIDEHTALLIGADGTGRLADGSHGHAWIVEPTRLPSVLKAGSPLSIEQVRLTRVDAASTFVSASCEVRDAGSRESLAVAGGKLQRSAPAER